MVAWPGRGPEELARASTGVGKEVEHNNELIKVQPRARWYGRLCSRSVKGSMEGLLQKGGLCTFTCTVGFSRRMLRD